MLRAGLQQQHRQSSDFAKTHSAGHPLQTEHSIAGKDASLESTIGSMQEKLERIGFNVEERRNDL